MGAIVPNHPIDNRREPRFETNNAITFSCLNKEAHYIGIARNISRSGMFFRSSRKLKPGTCLVILPLDCRATDLLWGNGDHGTMAAVMALDGVLEQRDALISRCRVGFRCNDSSG